MAKTPIRQNAVLRAVGEFTVQERTMGGVAVIGLEGG